MLPALHTAWGTVPDEDLSTVPGLAAAVEAWARGGEASRRLAPGLASMARQVRGLLEESRRDLELVEGELLDPAGRIVAGYEASAIALEALAASLAAGDRGAAEGSLDALRSAAAEVKEQQARIHAWLEAPVARCPRCGASGGSRCGSCDLDMLVLDASFLQDESHRTAVLPAEYVQVFEAWRDVHAGRGTLRALFARLDELEETVRTQLGMAETCAGEPSFEAIGPLLSCLETIREGIARMRTADQTRQMADLNAGWDLVFEAASRIQALRPALMRDAGQQGTSCADTVELGG